MNSQFDPAVELTDFSGTAPIFPLPHVVLFPHLSLPLHVFEERYRQLAADVLAGERLIALALLQPGWEPHYDQRPPTHQMTCLGRIIAEERLPSGRFNIVVKGVARAAQIDEPATATPYRVGRFEIYRDFYDRAPLHDRDQRRCELVQAFRRLFPRFRHDPMFTQIMEADIPLGVLCDLLANVLRIGAAKKQEILEELEVDKRSDLVLALARDLAAPTPEIEPDRFPPRFSLN